MPRKELTDREWFASNPGMTERIRLLDDADRAGIRAAGLERKQFNAVLVRQITPGVRIRVLGYFTALTKKEGAPPERRSLAIDRA